MLKIIYTLALLFFGNFYYTQSLSGKITDKENNAISFAEIVLTKNDIKKTAISDEKGNFTLQLPENGDYLLEILQDGNKVYSKTISVNGNISENINIEPKTQNIQEVTVTGNKKLIERKIDRLVFNVENSVAATGGDALDALKITPGLQVQNDQISMIGKSGMAVMVNNRIMRLSGDDLTNFLKTIKSDDIKSIEVITNPPAKYEAEGNSGIVNIVLKKALPNSWNAALRTSYEQATLPTGSGGGSFNYQKNKIGVYASADYTKGSTLSLEQNEVNYPEQLWTTVNKRRDFIKSIRGRVNLDYKVSNKWTAGLQYLGSHGQPDTKEDNKITISKYDTKAIDSIIQTNAFSLRKIDSQSLNLNNVISIDSSGSKKITIDMDYFKYKNSNNRNFDAQNYLSDYSVVDGSYSAANNIGIQNVDNYAASVDVEYPTKSIELNFGGKISYSKLKNDMEFYDTTNGFPIKDNSNSDLFDYKETIGSLYASAHKSFSDKWEAQLGLRLENTDTEGIQIISNNSNKRSYLKSFPTSYVQYKPNDNNSFGLSYGKRINRPSYWQQNPFKWYRSEYYYFEGNPNLEPSISHNFEFTYTYKQNFFTQLYYSLNKNEFNGISYLDSSINMVINRMENFYDTHQLGLIVYYRFNKWKWWDSSNVFNLVYQKVSPYYSYVNHNENTSYFFRTYNSFNVSETFSLELTFYYNSKTVQGSFKQGFASSLDFGGKLQMFHKSLILSASVNDLFKTSQRKLWDNVQNVAQYYHNYYDWRYFRLSLSYRFGNKKLSDKQAKEGSNQDQKTRIGF